MKTTRGLIYSFFAVAALLAGVQAAAQTIDNGIVSYTYLTTQQSAGAPVGASANPYSFQVFIEGSGITGVEGQSTEGNLPATVSVPPSPTVLDLVFSSSNGNGRMLYQSAGYASDTALQTAFPNSDVTNGPHYVLSANGQNPSLDLTSIGSSVMNLPTITLTGGSWNVGTGQYDFNPNSTLGISFNPVSGGSSDQFHFDYKFNGANTNGAGDQGFLNAGDTIDAVNDVQTFFNFQFQAGTYTIEVAYDDVMSFDPNGFGSGLIAAGIYEVRSTITLNAIPEPSTYAAIAGVLALAGVMIQRRRRTV